MFEEVQRPGQQNCKAELSDSSNLEQPKDFSKFALLNLAHWQSGKHTTFQRGLSRFCLDYSRSVLAVQGLINSNQGTACELVSVRMSILAIIHNILFFVWISLLPNHMETLQFSQNPLWMAGWDDMLQRKLLFDFRSTAFDQGKIH